MSSCRPCPTCYTPSCVLQFWPRCAWGSPPFTPLFPFLCAHCCWKEKSLSYLFRHYQTFILLPSSFFSLCLFNNTISPSVHDTTLVAYLPASLVPVQGLASGHPLCSVAAFQAQPPFSSFLCLCLPSPVLHWAWHSSQQRACQNPWGGEPACAQRAKDFPALTPHLETCGLSFL